MKTMRADGIVVLPIHDSFLVRTDYPQWLEVVMEAALKDVTGGIVATDADGPKLSKHFALSKKELINDESNGIVNGGSLELNSLFEESVMTRYLSYWQQWDSQKL
jgi:hypothetical protein